MSNIINLIKLTFSMMEFLFETFFTFSHFQSNYINFMNNLRRNQLSSIIVKFTVKLGLLLLLKPKLITI
jgi:hypothetical protein